MEEERDELFKELAKYIISDPRRISVLADIIHAMLNSRSMNAGDLAAFIYRDIDDVSIAQMLRRFYKNEHVTWETFYAPLIQEMLKSFPHPIGYIVIDTTDVGSAHRAVVVSLAYQNRSLPLIWHVEPGVKGHSSEEVQITLLEKLAQHITLKGCIIFLGDSEFSGVSVLEYVSEELNWYYACRVKPSRYVWVDEETGHPLADLVPEQSYKIQRLENVEYTTKHRFTTSIYACWEPGHKDPLILAYKLPPGLHPRCHYRVRFWTEPLFGDCKEAGLRLSTSRLQHPERLERLFLACAASYIWMVSLGAKLITSGKSKSVDRPHRRTLSIFKTGWRWFKKQIKAKKLVPFSLVLPSNLHLDPIPHNKP